MFRFLENPKYPSLGPHLKLLGFVGLWHPVQSKNTLLKRFLFYLSTSYFFSQYLRCLIKLDYESLDLILQYMTFHMGTVKSCFFKKDLHLWNDLINFISNEEHLLKYNRLNTVRESIKQYIKQNRRVTYFYFALAFFTNIGIFAEPYYKNRLILNETNYLIIFDGYTPFSYQPPGYYASMFVQTFLGHVFSAYIVGWDTLTVSIMIYFAGQMRIARSFCAYVIDEKDPAKSYKNIKEFHRYFNNLIRYQKLFKSLISPVMFVYLIVVSANLGLQIVKLKDDRSALVSSVLYVVACLIQLLYFYWHSNEVTHQSKLVSYGVFESAWPTADLKLKKKIFLLGFTTQKVLDFEAGPFQKMTLPTFLGILRTSYSFFTLLNGTN